MFKTSYIGNWNGLIAPYTAEQLKSLPQPKSVAIRPDKFNQNITGEVAHDLNIMSKDSKKKLAENLVKIDKIRKVDVPWVMYIFFFVVLMTAAIVACYFGLKALHVSYGTLIPICAVFILCLAVTFIFITILDI
jgi:hypothetical protein